MIMVEKNEQTEVLEAIAFESSAEVKILHPLSILISQKTAGSVGTDVTHMGLKEMAIALLNELSD